MPYPQTIEELNNHFKEQMLFLETSAKSFDSGNKSEAKRLAVTLRLLLHDTGKSKSLCTQLGLKGNSFLDTSNYEAYSETPWDVLVYTGLIGTDLNPFDKEVQFMPILDHQGNTPPKWRSFDLWWNMIVIKDTLGNTFSRRDLVLNMADKDGGAHVDPTITLEYADISRHNSLGVTGKSYSEKRARPIPGAELTAVRQITYEVQKSLLPGFRLVRSKPRPSGLVFNVLMLGEPKKFDPTGMCPCGNGKLYNECHGR